MVAYLEIPWAGKPPYIRELKVHMDVQHSGWTNLQGKLYFQVFLAFAREAA